LLAGIYWVRLFKLGGILQSGRLNFLQHIVAAADACQRRFQPIANSADDWSVSCGQLSLFDVLVCSNMVFGPRSLAS
jgi:hypothetical protein